MLNESFVVDACPPWKQSPADKDEKKKQEKLKLILQKEAKKTFKDSPILAPFAVVIIYSRKSDRFDSANIIGGILDSLEGIVFKNDKMRLRINYTEHEGDKDSYKVTITEV